MAAISVPSSQMPVNPSQPDMTAELKDLQRRVNALERSSLADLDARLTALEAVVFP